MGVLKDDLSHTKRLTIGIAWIPAHDLIKELYISLVEFISLNGPLQKNKLVLLTPL